MPTNTCFEMKAADYAYLRTLPGNDVCIDCGAKKPDWGTPSFGILFCFKCSGRHRGLGTHISFVRSVTMDAWTEKQIKFMKAGGNQKCKDFLQERGVNISRSTPIRQKYDNPAAQSYKLMLKAQVEEGSTTSATPAAAALPSTKTELPKQSQTEPEEAAGVASTQYTPPPTASAALLAAPAAVPHLGAAPVQPQPPATKKLKKKMEGFGNTPPPPPPNEGLKNLALVAVPLAVVAVGWFLVSH